MASSLNPNQTFLDLVGKENLASDFVKKVEGFKYSNTTPLFTLHLALNERMNWKAADYDPDVDRAYYICCGLEGLRDVEELYKDCAARIGDGWLPSFLSFQGDHRESPLRLDGL